LVADRRVRADPADGRHHRALFPRVLGGALSVDTDITGRVADDHADDVFAPAASRTGAQARAVFPMERTHIPACAWPLRTHAAYCARGSRVDDVRPAGDGVLEYIFIHPDTEG